MYEVEQESIEVYDPTQWLYRPVYVSIDGNWPGAVLAAAKLDRAEIIVVVGDCLSGTCVYSDDADIASSPWWAAQVRERRRFLGR